MELYLTFAAIYTFSKDLLAFDFFDLRWYYTIKIINILHSSIFSHHQTQPLLSTLDTHSLTHHLLASLAASGQVSQARPFSRLHSCIFSPGQLSTSHVLSCGVSVAQGSCVSQIPVSGPSLGSCLLIRPLLVLT